MNLRKVSDQELIFDLKNLISEERELLTAILRYLKEVEIRKIYLQRGFPSMFAYVTEELGYSEGAAQRRIQAMRLLKDLPEVEAMIETGEISLSVASQVQSYLKKEEKKAPIKKEEKLALIDNVSGSSARECERKLIGLSPEAALPREKTRPITEDKTQIQFVAGSNLMKKIERLKELTSHTNPEGKYEELFSKALDIALKQLDPLQRKTKKFKKTKTQSRSSKSLIHIGGNRSLKSQCSAIVGKALSDNKQLPEPSTKTPPPCTVRYGAPPTSAVKRNRYIPKPIRDQVYLRDQGKCQFQNKTTGKLCGSRYQIQIDHRFPYSLGGEHKLNNLRLRCRQHNQYHAEQILGLNYF